jgi:hypothetical protein
MQIIYKSILLNLVVVIINHNKITDKNKRNLYLILFWIEEKEI